MKPGVKAIYEKGCELGLIIYEYDAQEIWSAVERDLSLLPSKELDGKILKDILFKGGVGVRISDERYEESATLINRFMKTGHIDKGIPFSEALSILKNQACIGIRPKHNTDHMYLKGGKLIWSCYPSESIEAMTIRTDQLFGLWTLVFEGD